MAFDVKVPSPGESVTEVIIDNWLKKDGEAVKRDEAIAEIQSDKAMLTLYAEQDGVLRILAQPDDTVAVGAIIARIEEGTGTAATAPVAKAEAPKAQADAAPAAVTQPATASSYAAGTPSPAAEKILAEKGVAAASVAGSGPGGRITKADALAAQPTAPAGNGAAAAPATVVAPAVAGQQRGFRREKMTSLRKTLAARLVSVKNETAMLTTFQEVDMSAVLDLRKKYNEAFEKKHGFKIGFMGFFTKACCEALREWPAVNAGIVGDEIEYHDYVNMGIAVSTDRGLVVPVIRDADLLSIPQIDTEVAAIAKKAREGKITIPDMQGGTFTITNGGVFGSMMSTPILNPPQSAILGMHRTVERPTVVNGQVVVRPIMYLALSYDHRIIDGRESVSFLFRVKEFLEDPARMLLGA
jgi:2-oxoglutarate dehydrogenase E2 component (dihydrolipoamide succinyltransferase)